MPFISACVRAFWEYLFELFRKDWKGFGWLCLCTVQKLVKSTSSEPYLLKAPWASSFDLRWARWNLETALLFLLHSSEIASRQINGRLATQTGEPSNAPFSLARILLIWANYSEPLPLDERQFVLPLLFGRKHNGHARLCSRFDSLEVQFGLLGIAKPGLRRNGFLHGKNCQTCVGSQYFVLDKFSFHMFHQTHCYVWKQ